VPISNALQNADDGIGEQVEQGTRGDWIGTTLRRYS
jgi:hypothetical protein